MLKNKIFLIIAVLILSATLLTHIYSNEIKEAPLKVHFLDIGQGDAILIETPNKNQILIDTGLNAKVVSEISRVTPFYDKNLDATLITHPDMDHVGGLPYVLDSYNVDYIFHEKLFAESANFQGINKRLGKTISREINQTERIDLGGGLFLEILFPFDDFVTENKNDDSIVAKLTYGDTSFLFTGDVSIDIEEILVDTYGKDLSSDVLKIGHHGSDTSSGEDFIDFVDPSIAVISVGAENDYGHPKEEVLQRLTVREIEVLRTDILGTITIESDGKEVRIKK